MSSAARRERVQGALPDGIDALLVTAPTNVRYLTGFTGSNGQLLLAADPVFFTDGRYQEQSAVQVPDLAREVYSGPTRLSDLLGKALADRGISKIGIEALHLTVATREKLAGELAEQLEGVELVSTTEVVESLRRRKDATEIASIRQAQRIAELALTKTLDEFQGGTEVDLSLALEWAMRTAGAESVAFDVIVAGGAHSALPHAVPRRKPVDLDGVLLVDMGARVEGYCSDMTRTFLGPRAPEEMTKVHAAVCAALDAACRAVRPGVECAAVDKAARDVLEAEGYLEGFVHSTGHGVGLEIHEGPTLSPVSEGTLEPGMVVTVEPGVYLPGVGGVRVEDLLVVTEHAADNLTSLPRGPSTVA